MKTVLSIICCAIIFFEGNAQVGVGANNPNAALHVVSNTNPARVQGLKPAPANAESYLLIRPDGTVMATQDVEQNSFYIPSVINTSGVNLTSSVGFAAYTEGSAPSDYNWTFIPGMRETITVTKPINSISANVEGMAQLNNASGITYNVSYSIGIFVDGKLRAVRSFVIVGDNATRGQSMKWAVLGNFRNISVGNHTIEVYARRRTTSSGAPSGLTLTIGAPANLNPPNQNTNMTQIVMQIDGSYNIEEN